ncbi:MAG: Rieske 2Fe-2S domain-containing protein [Rhizomicrobium sp.]
MTGDRAPLPRNAWYVAAASVRLKDVPLAVRLFGSPVVLFRRADGSPVALHDRCPHRGTPLSLGRTEDDGITCAYHGWRFGADGACRHIPSLLDGRGIAKGVVTNRYPCVEQDGYVWVWPGDETPSAASPSAIDGFANGAWLQGEIDLACEALLPIENNLDLCHAVFTHPGKHPQAIAVERSGFHRRLYEMRPTASGLEVSGEDGTSLRFDLPDRVTVKSNAKLTIVLHHTPTRAQRCRQHWLVPLPNANDQPHAVFWSDQEPEILKQDQLILEAAQLNYERESESFERSVEADAPTLAVRRVLRIAAQGRWPAAALSDQAPRTITVRS